MEIRKVIPRIKEIRKGHSTHKNKVVFEEGEPVYIIDKKRLYVGDNRTYGGTESVSKNYIIDKNELFSYSARTDIMVNPSTGCVSIVDLEMKLSPITNIQCSIKNISNLVEYISARIDGRKPPVGIDIPLTILSASSGYLATDRETALFSDPIFTDDSNTIEID
jgi:hypothetical protein